MVSHDEPSVDLHALGVDTTIMGLLLELLFSRCQLWHGGLRSTTRFLWEQHGPHIIGVAGPVPSFPCLHLYQSLCAQSPAVQELAKVTVAAKESYRKARAKMKAQEVRDLLDLPFGIHPETN